MSLDKTSGNRNLLDQRLNTSCRSAPARAKLAYVTTMLRVEAGIGIAAVPAMSMPASEHSVLTSVPLVDPVVKRTVGLIRRGGRMQSFVAAELEKLITEQYHSA